MLSEQDGKWLEWQAPGPVAARFMASRAEVQIINGPIGSGKTTAALIKLLRLSAQQTPSPLMRARNAKGRLVPARLFKAAVIRDTYRQMWRTTIPSWLKRVPQSSGEWIGGRNTPSLHRVPIVIDRGSINETVVDFQVEFAAIQDNDVEEFMRGYEVTCFYLNELDTLPWEILAYAQGRAGRYPDMADGGARWKGILADCNAPVLQSALYKEVFQKSPAVLKPLSVALFIQPGGRDPGAENRANLPGNYYMPKIGQDDMYVARMIDNRPGYSRGGKPVYGEFNPLRHVAPQELEAMPGLPLYIGFDAGLDPSALIGQKLGNGRWNIIDEVTSEHGTGALRFARALNELLRERYPDWHALPAAASDDADGVASLRPWQGASSPRQGNIRGWCDPSATYGGDRSSEAEADRTWQELVSYHTGIRIAPAGTNDQTTRKEALRHVLTLMPDGNPAFQVSPRCERFVAGMSGGYRWRKLNLSGADERYTDMPEKNEYSHIVEAGEYLMLGGGEGAEVHERRQRGWDTHNLPRGSDYEWGMT